MTTEEILQAILKKEQLEYIRRLDERMLMCKRLDDSFVVMKFGQKADQLGFKKAETTLAYLNQFEFQKTKVPSVITISEDTDPYAYMLLSYEEFESQRWSNVNGSSDWGGRNITLDYLGQFLDSLDELQQLDTKPLGMYINIAAVDSATAQLNELEQRNLITPEQKTVVIAFLNQHVQDFFLGTPVVTNEHFYPPNVIPLSGEKMYIIDWDNASVQVLEQVLMTMWASFMGNPEFQGAYIGLLKQRGIPLERLTVGLIFASLDFLVWWMKEQQHSEAVNTLVGYIVNHENIFSPNKPTKKESETI